MAGRRLSGLAAAVAACLLAGTSVQAQAPTMSTPAVQAQVPTMSTPAVQAQAPTMSTPAVPPQVPPQVQMQADAAKAAGEPDAPANRYEVLRVAYDPTLPPLQFRMDSGAATGFLIDIMNRIGEAAGMAVSLYPYDRDDAARALADGGVDVVLGAPYSTGSFTSSPDVIVSEPMYASAVAVVTIRGDQRYADGVARLAQGVLALTRGSPAYDFLKAIRAVHFNETSRPADALELLALGRADAFLEDRAVAAQLLAERPDRERFELASSYWLPVEYGMAVHQDDEYLLYRLNQGLGAIKESGAYSAAYERWFDDSEQLARQRLRAAVYAFVAALAVLLLVGGGSFWWNRQLSAQVRAGTSELRLANEQLERLAGEAMDRSEFIAQILESSPRGLVTLGLDGKVAMCNVRGRVIGVLDPDPVGRHFGDFPFLSRFLPDDRMKRVLRGETFPFETVEWIRPDGTHVHIRNGLYPQLDHEGQVVGVIFSFEDHTNEKAIMQRLAEREKDEALGRIVAGVAHEIRNPLTAVKAFVEMLPSRLDDARFLRELGATVPREVERMDALIRDLIDFSRPRKPLRSIVDLSALAESCVALAGPALTKRGVWLVFSEPPEGDACTANIDADQIRQCIINLILNAADAVESAATAAAPSAGPDGNSETGESRVTSGSSVTDGNSVTGGSRAGGGGSGLTGDRAAEGMTDIVVGISRSGASVVMEVADTGPGMDQATVARVFEPFYTTKRSGVGLGLPLSRQYVEENGGHLAMTSEPGTGTRVTLVFPLASAGKIGDHP